MGPIYETDIPPVDRFSKLHRNVICLVSAVAIIIIIDLYSATRLESRFRLWNEIFHKVFQATYCIFNSHNLHR